MNEYPDSCRKCPVKKKCGYKYKEHNRIPRGIGCLFNKKEDKEMKYEFVLTEQMENDRKNCGEDSRCLECSCRMGEDDCIFNHLYTTAELPIETTFDAIKSMDINTLAIYLHSWQVENKTIEEIKRMLNEKK